ncbi:MAG: transcriptional repressor [Lachnospiraceae bacterium]|nr:transcriptional repressor [Lachnospiraceae bacterium]
MENNKKEIIDCLREQGFRITKQREILIDIILQENFSCCKEVYYLALKKDPGIGIATVYRTMDALEKIGALNRENAYRVCRENNDGCFGYLIELEDKSTVRLNYCDVERIIEEGIKQNGLSEGQKIKNITLLPADKRT